MTNLKQKILNEIQSQGSMPVDRYMELCNTHYYSTRDPLGTAGDFTTSPEISQVFGETIAVWAITKWQELGSLTEIAILELGPGRGTLMADFLRAIKVAPDFKPQIHLVEMSPVLRKKQEEKLKDYDVQWHKTAPALDIPTILIANEFFDALPIKQFIGEKERMIVEQDGKLAFNSPAEMISEKSLLSEELMSKLSASCDAGVIIDYGYLEGSGDSFQAMRSHKYEHTLQNPGEADLTAHVNFAALTKSCQKPCNVITQREFLLSYGGDVRAKMLGVGEDFARLINPEEMGELFKVLCF